QPRFEIPGMPGRHDASIATPSRRDRPQRAKIRATAVKLANTTGRPDELSTVIDARFHTARRYRHPLGRPPRFLFPAAARFLIADGRPARDFDSVRSPDVVSIRQFVRLAALALALAVAGAACGGSPTSPPPPPPPGPVAITCPAAVTLPSP